MISKRLFDAVSGPWPSSKKLNAYKRKREREREGDGE